MKKHQKKSFLEYYTFHQIQPNYKTCLLAQWQQRGTCKHWPDLYNP